MTPSHPLRCETCTHYEEHICLHQHNRMSNIELTLIEMVGCASHSAASRPAPSPETITKELALELCMDARKEAAAQAREDLLKEIVERMQSNRGEVIRISTDATAIGVFDGTMLYLKSLRRTGGDE